MMKKTENAIYLKAKKLGITLIQDRRNWTIDDEEYLKERWGRDTIENISLKMKRSIFSLKVHATRMNLGRMSLANIDEINVNDISEILNVSRDKITNTWAKLGLKLKHKKVTKKYSYYCICLDKLFLFLKEHQDLWNSQYLEKNILGEEPVWLIEKRKKDIINPPNEYKIWTDEEIELAKNLLLKGYNYEDIAKQVNHTACAVSYKLRELSLSYKLSRYWKSSELKYLRENYEKMTCSEIGENLGRTGKAVSSKAQELGYQKKITKKGVK